MRQVALSVIKLVFSSSLMRLGSGIALLGAAAIVSISQIVIEALFSMAGHPLELPEASIWAGWLLLAVGVGIAVYAHRQQAAQADVAANPHDMANIRKLRGLVGPSLMFYRQHNFHASFPRSRTSGFDEFVDDWRGAQHEFVDAEVQARALALHAKALDLAELIAVHTYPLDTNVAWSTVDPGRGAMDAEARAQESARALNEAATAYVTAVDELERVAKVRLPDSGQPALPAQPSSGPSQG